MPEKDLAKDSVENSSVEAMKNVPSSRLSSDQFRAQFRSRDRGRWWQSDSEEGRWRPVLRVLRFLPFILFECFSGYSLAFESSYFGLSEKASVLLPHGVACLVLPVALFPWLPASYRESSWLTTGLVLGISLPLPLFGPVCVMVILKLLNKLSTCKVKNEVPFWVVGSRVPDAEGVDFVRGKDSSDSILQVMNGPNPIARRNLILATKRLPPEEAVPILRTGLRDSDEEVKLYAQGILSQLVERYEDSVADLKKDLLSHPDDTVLSVRLAEQLCEIVDLNLVTDRELQLFYISNAVELLEKVLDLEPGNDEVLILLARYHLKINEPDAALGAVERLRELGTSSEVLEPVEIEAFFQKRCWPEFRARLSGGLVNRFCDPQLQRLSEYWIGVHSKSGAVESGESKLNVLGSS